MSPTIQTLQYYLKKFDSKANLTITGGNVFTISVDTPKGPHEIQSPYYEKVIEDAVIFFEKFGNNVFQTAENKIAHKEPESVQPDTQVQPIAHQPSVESPHEVQSNQVPVQPVQPQQASVVQPVPASSPAPQTATEVVNADQGYETNSLGQYQEGPSGEGSIRV